jgi:hypothetical protein
MPEPILSKKDKFPNTENTTSANIFLFANAKIISETTNAAPSKKNVIQISTRALPRSNIFFQQLTRNFYFAKIVFQLIIIILNYFHFIFKYPRFSTKRLATL